MKRSRDNQRSASRTSNNRGAMDHPMDELGAIEEEDHAAVNANMESIIGMEIKIRDKSPQESDRSNSMDITIVH